MMDKNSNAMIPEQNDLPALSIGKSAIKEARRSKKAKSTFGQLDPRRQKRGKFWRQGQPIVSGDW